LWYQIISDFFVKYLFLIST